jgi:hypothetical protein
VHGICTKSVRSCRPPFFVYRNQRENLPEDKETYERNEPWSPIQVSYWANSTRHHLVTDATRGLFSSSVLTHGRSYKSVRTHHLYMGRVKQCVVSPYDDHFVAGVTADNRILYARTPECDAQFMHVSMDKHEDGRARPRARLS